MDINVKLMDHVGESDTPFGKITLTHPQKIIMASTPELKKRRKTEWVQIGYVGTHPGAPINWIPMANHLPDAAKDAIAVKVARMLGEESKPHYSPPQRHVLPRAFETTE